MAGISYTNQYSGCPKRNLEKLTAELHKVFSKKKSLWDVKKFIVEKDLAKKNFLMSYKIDYSPIKADLTFSYECPLPILKLQFISDKKDQDHYVLGENGELYDPTYLEILKNEEKVEHLPDLALPKKLGEKDFLKNLALMVKNIPITLHEALSEIIVNEEKDLTLVLSLRERPMSVFLGSDQWEEKTQKLTKILDYLGTKNRIPSVMNMTSLKKVIVKFPHAF